ncbi:MAG TPA: CoA transferase [Jatrophihabitans sp.]
MTPPNSFNPAPAALEGLRVLELATLYAAPAIGAALGDFGADVVKVEPPHGDPLRRLSPDTWLLTARNKRSFSIDFKSEAGLAELAALADIADCILVNQPLRILKRWGVSYEQVRKRNPRVVYVSVSTYGASGPLAGVVGNGSIGEAFGGFTNLNGLAETGPLLTSLPVGDFLASLSGIIGTLAACYWRDARGGDGQFVDISMYEPILALLGSSLAGWVPGTPPPMRNGGLIDGTTPRRTYHTADGEWVVVSGPTDQQVARLLPLIGADSPGDLERFGSSAARARHAGDLDQLVESWIQQHPVTHVLTAMRDARIPCSQVQDLEAIVNNKHIRERQSLYALGDGGEQRFLPSPIPSMSKTPGRVAHAATPAGHDTEVIRKQWLANLTDPV